MMMASVMFSKDKTHLTFDVMTFLQSLNLITGGPFVTTYVRHSVLGARLHCLLLPLPSASHVTHYSTGMSES